MLTHCLTCRWARVLQPRFSTSTLPISGGNSSAVAVQAR